jgi:hypothetical protein
MAKHWTKLASEKEQDIRALAATQLRRDQLGIGDGDPNLLGCADGIGLPPPDRQSSADEAGELG